MTFFDDLANTISEANNVHVAQTDLTASIFWGIWPYGLPYTRYYVHTITNNFEYVYEEYKIDAYIKFLKKKSTNFLRYIVEKKKKKAQPPTPDQIEKDWWVRHCPNLNLHPKLLVENFLYFKPDYDEIVELMV